MPIRPPGRRLSENPATDAEVITIKLTLDRDTDKKLRRRVLELNTSRTVYLRDLITRDLDRTQTATN